MRHRRTFAIFTGLFVVAGCQKNEPRPIDAPPPNVQLVPTGDPTGGGGGGSASVNLTNCTQCHGTPGLDSTGSDPLVASAPPRALDGTESAPAVGAHRKHLVNGSLSNAVECASCHLVPTAATLPHVAQQQGKVTFSRLATVAWTGPRVSPAWNGTTCASTYCHGNFRNGNAGNAPSWTGGQAAGGCGTCHGIAPGGSHPVVAADESCGVCHPGYTRTTVNAATHLNGVLDGSGHSAGWKEPDQHGLAALSENLDPCTACHTGYGPVSGAGAGTSCDACHASPNAYGPYATSPTTGYPDHADWQTECTFCHGGRDNATGAPARNTHVVSSDTTTPQPTTNPTIGAHTAHVEGSSMAAALDCTACHETRWTSALDPGHVDKATADVFFNAVGPTANPGTYASASCSSTYCHGNFSGGAGSGPISWTGSVTLGCTSCHGFPPGPASATVHHPPNADCTTCHPNLSSPPTHVNGIADHVPATGCTQCHGDLAATAVPNTDVRAAPAGDASAVDAHGNAATATTARGVGAHAKHLTGTTWRNDAIACGECHAVPGAGDVAHANGNPAVAFGLLASTAWSGQQAITPVWNGAGGSASLTCSSTYCHGAFKNGARAAPTWAAPSAVGCGSCHGTPPGGTHPAGSNCAQCHDAGYSWNGSTGTVNPALHMNGQLDVANLTCTSCHGTTGRASVAGADANQAAAPPVDASGAASSAAVGAHLAHVNQGDTTGPALSSPLACANCHLVPSSTTHSTGTVNVTFGAIATTGGAAPAAYDFANHRCASTYCHGNFPGGAGANPITWSAPPGKLACTSCHAVPPSATDHHPPNPSCGSCHGAGYSTTTVAAATHVNGAVDHTPPTGCTQCHGDLTASAVPSGDVLAAPASNAAAVDAHGDAATATSARGVGAHAKHLTGATWRNDPIACGECHAVPGAGDLAHANGDPAVAFGTLAKTAWTGPALTPAWNGAGGAANLTCSNTYCHGDFPNGANASPTWTASGSVACGSCHLVSATDGPGGTHPTLGAGMNCGSCHGGSYTNTSVDKMLHMNGALDGGGESTGGSSCGGCHSTIWNAMNGTVAKTTRHALLKDVPIDDSTAWTGASLSAVPASSRSCVNMCHGDHPHGLTSPLVDTHQNNALLDASTQASRAAATRTSATRASTDFDGTQTNGGMCVSCHRTQVDADRPAVGKAAFDASAHDFTSNAVGATTYTWSYGLHDGGAFARNCTKCHASSDEGTTPAAGASGSQTVSVHYGDDASLLAGTSRPAGTAAGFVCYNCHGSVASPANGAQGNRSGKNIQTQVQKAYAHPANADAVHESAAEYANASFGNALGGAARHASCLDCHDTHEAKSGAHAAGTNLAGRPLQGAWGAKLSTNPAFWTAPTSASFTKTTIVAETDLEATLCFKCHSSFYWGTGTAPTSPSGGFAQTDTAKELNPANVGNYAGGASASWASGETAGGFHPVLAAAGANLGAVRLTNLVTTSIAWSTTARNVMTCTDCHESDTATDPNGPHGSAAKFVLRGPNTGWASTTTMATNGMPPGTFCANCHSATFSNSRFSQHYSRSDHRIACWNCHAAIPHGGPRPGMLIAPAGASANVGGTLAGWDNAAPYWGLGTSADKLYIQSYPVNNTTNWGQNNCGCNGTGH